MTLELYVNSFVTVKEADDYFDARPDSDAWSELTSTQKEKALIYASSKINVMDFVGQKAEPAQPMAYPRDFEMTVPLEIKYAVCEEALAQTEKSVHLKNRREGISSVTIGSASYSYFSDKSFDGLLSPEAFSLLSSRLQKGYDARG